MATEIDAVIAALRVVLAEAEQRKDYLSWDIAKVNDWIARLPGAWWGRWRHLKLRPDWTSGSSASTQNLISHVRATVAYLESYRSTTRPSVFRFLSFARNHTKALKSTDPKPKAISTPENKRLLH
jgi:hypothetical protein